MLPSAKGRAARAERPQGVPSLLALEHAATPRARHASPPCSAYGLQPLLEEEVERETAHMRLRWARLGACLPPFLRHRRPAISLVPRDLRSAPVLSPPASLLRSGSAASWPACLALGLTRAPTCLLPGRLGDGVEFRIGEGGDGLMARGTLPKGTQRK